MSLGLALISIAALLALYATFVVALLIAGRRTEARALAGFIPDSIVLVKRLLGDERVAGRRKLALVGLLAYLALPIDLVPDLIPVAGQLDDAILVALVLRFVVGGGTPQLIDEHWPGPPPGARVIKRLAFGPQTGGSVPAGRFHLRDR